MAAGSSSGEESAAGTGPAPQEIQTETQDVKALMAKFAQVCRDSGILGVTDPDTGVNTLLCTSENTP
eukprot:COSAG06_NODE_12473_length_1375_cov_1.847298_2_plen_67_part_00